MLRDHLRTALAAHTDAATALPRTLLHLARLLAPATPAPQTAVPPAGRLPQRTRPASGARSRVARAAGLVAALPVSLLGLVIVATVWAVFLARGVCYPLFGADHLDQSWGGPTLAGAWFVHFIQGPPLLYLVSFALRPLAWARRQLSNDIQVVLGGP